jgi:glycosyltransferase involved in cell wall biosynthesis
MNAISVVIITHNEERNIADCIQSARLVSGNIIVVDAGSDDATVQQALQSGASVFSVAWGGYGASRNFGAEKARHDWILALDADERISPELAVAIAELKLPDSNCLYRFHRKNYLNRQKIRFGTPGFETVKRIYNRKYAQWDLTPVHEKLVSEKPEKKRIRGHIDHFGLKSKEDHKAKAVLYAQMSAEKYFLQGRKTYFLKRYFSPLFNAAKSYIFQLGFLDGANGWTIAKNIAYYSWLKYFYLHQLRKNAKIREVRFSPKPRVERA